METIETNMMDWLIVELFLNNPYSQAQGMFQFPCTNCRYAGRNVPITINTRFEPTGNYEGVKYAQFLLGRWGSDQKEKILMIVGIGMNSSLHGPDSLKYSDGKLVEPVWIFSEEQGFSCMERYTTLEEIKKIYKLI